jgi:hypothetical protein
VIVGIVSYLNTERDACVGAVGGFKCGGARYERESRVLQRCQVLDRLADARFSN